jgi:hypothetical protein
MSTAFVRPLPDFLIIGTKRGGTTSLYRYLEAHPAVLPLVPSARHLPLRDNMKGVRYFDTGYHHSRSWYRSHFPTAATRALAARETEVAPITGEASPYYLFHPTAAERAADVVADAKVIVLLRDPVERAYSHHAEQCRGGAEGLSFEEAVRAEPVRLAGEAERIRRDPRYRSHAHQHQSYVAQSRYAESLARWQAHFPAERMLVVCSEELFASPERELHRVQTFLGLPHHCPPDLEPRNSAARAPMAADVRRTLEAALWDDVRQLERQVGRAFPWAWAATDGVLREPTTADAAVTAPHRPSWTGRQA